MLGPQANIQVCYTQNDKSNKPLQISKEECSNVKKKICRNLVYFRLNSAVNVQIYGHNQVDLKSFQDTEFLRQIFRSVTPRMTNHIKKDLILCYRYFQTFEFFLALLLVFCTTFNVQIFSFLVLFKMYGTFLSPLRTWF